MESFTSRVRLRNVSPTLAICAIASLVTAVGLFLPSLSPVHAPSNTYGAGAAPAEASGVEIVGFAFTGDLTARPGETVQVVNRDGVPHTLTAGNGAFDTGVIAGEGNGSFSAPDSDGVIAFICTIHPSMTGQLTIES